MKLHITQKQWDKLDKQQNTFWSKHNKIYKSVDTLLPNIGDMIEFLGDDLGHLDNDPEQGWFAICRGASGFWHEELVDALWEAVNLKLNYENFKV